MGTVRIGGIVKASPSTQFWLEADWVAQSGNASLLHVGLRAANGPQGIGSSQFGGSGFQRAWWAGGELGRHSGNPFLPSGYATNQQRWNDQWDHWIGHNPDGSFPSYRSDGQAGVDFGMQLAYGSINESYYGSIGAPPRIAQVPGTPFNLNVRAGTLSPTSFGVDYARGADNGAGIQEDQAEWSRAADGVVVWNDFGPAGYTSPNGGATPGSPPLTPGTEYRVRIRSRNAAGWGPWSGYVSATTLSGARVGRAGSFVTAEARVGRGGAFATPQVLIGRGGVFVPAT